MEIDELSLDLALAVSKMFHDLLLAQADLRQLSEEFFHAVGRSSRLSKRGKTGDRCVKKRSLVGETFLNMRAFSTSVARWKDHTTRRAQ